MSAINEIIQKGNAYRICVDDSDPTDLKWARQSFWTASSDVEFEDGMTAEQKFGSLKGLASGSDENPEGSYIVDTNYLKQQLSGLMKVISFDEKTATLTVTKIN